MPTRVSYLPFVYDISAGTVSTTSLPLSYSVLGYSYESVSFVAVPYITRSIALEIPYRLYPEQTFILGSALVHQIEGTTVCKYSLSNDVEVIYDIPFPLHLDKLETTTTIVSPFTRLLDGEPSQLTATFTTLIADTVTTLDLPFAGYLPDSVHTLSISDMTPIDGGYAWTIESGFTSPLEVSMPVPCGFCYPVEDTLHRIVSDFIIYPVISLNFDIVASYSTFIPDTVIAVEVPFTTFLEDSSWEMLLGHYQFLEDRATALTAHFTSPIEFIGIDISYQLHTLVESSFSVPIHLGSFVEHRSEVGSWLNTLVSKEVTVPAGLDSFWEVEQRNTVSYYIPPENGTQVYTVSPHIYVGSVEILALSFTIKQAEGSVYWTTSLELADIHQATLLVPQETIFTIEIALDDSYTFRVDTKVITKSSPGNIQVNITGVSPQKPPLSAVRPYTKHWTQDVLISEVAKDLFPQVMWESVDWMLPANMMSYTDVDRMVVLQELATSIGAVIEASKEGASLHIRPTFPSSVSKPIISHAINEVEEIFSLKESATTTKVENCFDVYDVGSGSGGDTLDFEAGALEVLDLTRRESPYNTTLVGTLHVVVRSCPEYRVRHLTPESVSMTSLGRRRRPLTETITFIKGVGNASRPIYRITDIKGYGLDPTKVSFAEGYTALELQNEYPQLAYGAAKVTYETESDDYYVRYTGLAVEWVDTFILEQLDRTI